MTVASRHTYCAARLHTLDQGAPVSAYTVAKEMGRGGETMVRRVCGHLGQLRHRAKAVEYRVEQDFANLGRAAGPRERSDVGTTIDTAGRGSQPYRVSRSAATPRA